MNATDFIGHLTDRDTSYDTQAELLATFAENLGWHPSDRLHIEELAGFASAHLVVEHGLENSAVLSFLRFPRRYADLSFDERNALIALSYNNLVDWHIAIERHAVSFVFNRTDPPRVVQQLPLDGGQSDQLRSEWFEQVAGRRPSPNVPALDDALIATISFWKRALASEVGPVSNTHFSHLFNAIIFARAAEDGLSRRNNTRDERSELLLSLLKGRTVSSALREAIRLLTGEAEQPGGIDLDQVTLFDALPESTIRPLFTDFYRNRFAPYSYDFSVISKHALSRIYEHYVSLLRMGETAQSALFPSLPHEEMEKQYGSVYTPQYVARFFARYLRQNTPSSTKFIRVLDPACGSGIFLRTILEIEYDSVPLPEPNQVGVALGLVAGIDIDENAVNATKLSLSLLHLVLTGTLPVSLPVVAGDALKLLKNNKDTFDGIVANPPFVATKAQSAEMRQRISGVLGDLQSGRVDLYLAFLKLAVDRLAPGGLGLFVIPHTFLLSSAAAPIRKLVTEHGWVHCVADLSAIRVFGDLGVYVVLLVFQKKSDSLVAPPVLTVRCQDMVGQALHDALMRKVQQNSAYSIFELPQESFGGAPWLLMPPDEAGLTNRLTRMPRLDDIFAVSKGVITGADSIFIRARADVPEEELDLYVPFLPDRQMTAYDVPVDTKLLCLYPYSKFPTVSENLLLAYENTWAHLLANRTRLQQRAAVRNGSMQWWALERPRDPALLLNTKIIAPHLVVVPKFSIDAKGEYVVSQSPVIRPLAEGTASDLLKLYLAVLNSSTFFWLLSQHSQRYQRGYVMLEPAALKRTRVPGENNISPSLRKKVLFTVERRLQMGFDAVIEAEIDDLVTEMYGLSAHEKNLVRGRQ